MITAFIQSLCFVTIGRRQYCCLQRRCLSVLHLSDFGLRWYRKVHSSSRCHDYGLCSCSLFHSHSLHLFSEFYVCHYNCCHRCPCISFHRGHDDRHQQILVILDSSLRCPLLLSQLKATESRIYRFFLYTYFVFSV